MFSLRPLRLCGALFYRRNAGSAEKSIWPAPPATTMLMNPAGSLLREFFSFINEHDGDVVFDFIHQLARLANQAIALVIEFDFPFTLGAG
jgi:hypothetical protein